MNQTHIWQTMCKLPEKENDAIPDDCARTQLLAGASADGCYIYDAVYDAERDGFVLTLMSINQEWGLIEHEKCLFLPTRQALFNAVATFQAAPHQAFE